MQFQKYFIKTLTFYSCIQPMMK